MSLVLDRSATLAWLYPDETTLAILAVFDQLVLQGALVPQPWRVEIANCLTIGVRRSRVSATERNAWLADLSDLPIAIDDDSSRYTWGKTLELADKHRLTVYDATYLELAIRKNLPLASLDGELRAAAVADGFPVLGI